MPTTKMEPCRILLGLMCLVMFYRHITTYSSSQVLLKTPGQLLKGNIRKYIQENTCLQRQASTLMVLAMLLSGDVHSNPGPRQRSYYPCGLCDRDVKCLDCIACDECSIWYHRSCVELSFADFEHLQKSTAAWICPKCDSI